MRILLSNDDGIRADGIEALAKVLSRAHEVIVAAPAHEQSGMAHALTVRQKLEVSHYAPMEESYGVTALAIGGTPTDCVKLYLEALAGESRPDLVLSGINHGANLGTDVLYSGTVGAAMEGFLHGIPSVAISQDSKSGLPYEETAEMAVARIMQFFREEEKPFFFNMNFPRQLCSTPPQFAFTRVGCRDYVNAFRRIEEGDGKVFYCMEGEICDVDNDEETDIHAVNRGMVSVTPLQTDLTDYFALEGKRGG